jgi:DNA-binding CsgD family transcriptional regulator
VDLPSARKRKSTARHSEVAAAQIQEEPSRHRPYGCLAKGEREKGVLRSYLLYRRHRLCSGPAHRDELAFCTSCSMSVRWSSCGPSARKRWFMLATLDPGGRGRFSHQPSSLARPDHSLMARSSKMPLTHREHEVVELIRQALTNSEIGNRLGLSPWTVKRHVARVLAKTGCRRRVDLAVHYGSTATDRPRAEPLPSAADPA